MEKSCHFCVLEQFKTPATKFCNHNIDRPILYFCRIGRPFLFLHRVLQPTGTNRFWRIKFPHSFAAKHYNTSVLSHFAVFAAKKFYFRQNCSAPANGRFVPGGCNTTSRSFTAFKRFLHFTPEISLRQQGLRQKGEGDLSPKTAKALYPLS